MQRIDQKLQKYENITYLCLHFARQNGQYGKNRKENQATKVTKIPKTKRRKYGMNKTKDAKINHMKSFLISFQLIFKRIKLIDKIWFRNRMYLIDERFLFHPLLDSVPRRFIDISCLWVYFFWLIQGYHFDIFKLKSCFFLFEFLPKFDKNAYVTK